MFEIEIFRKQMHCIEESTCDMVGTFLRPPQCFGAPIVTLRPENCAPLAPFNMQLRWLAFFTRFCDLNRVGKILMQSISNLHTGRIWHAGR